MRAKVEEHREKEGSVAIKGEQVATGEERLKEKEGEENDCQEEA